MGQALPRRPRLVTERRRNLSASGLGLGSVM
jgi:hypothetical protein